MSSELVQIEALHQSTEQVMSCPVFYVEAFPKGRKQPGGLESARGVQVHHVGSEYASWCAKKSVAQDLEAFDRFALGAGPSASKILIGMRDSYLVDYKHLLATELTMRLDEDLNPTDTVDALEGIAGDSGLPAAYEGILDALYVYREEAKINIDDLKTHPQPFDPKDTLQGPMYAVFCFRHFPWVREIKFKLIFVRYNNLFREVTYTREDLPFLVEMVRAARARQKMLHTMYAAGEELEAVPGNHCFSGDTRFLTEAGIRTLRDACGESVRVLNRHGEWEDAEIRSFGFQQLLRITFDDGSVVRSTPEHRWWKLKKDQYTQGWVQTNERITTRELDRVPIVRHAHFAELHEDGIRHGFVYGDGYKRTGRPSCVAVVTPPKDEHMLRYFPGAKLYRGRYKKGGLPEHFKTLNGIDSPSYARGFLAGLLAADGCVCKNGGVHLDCEGRIKATAISEIVRFGGGVVSSIRLSDGKPTKFSPKGATSRELMRMDIKPSTAPILTPKHRERIKSKSQMRRMYREVVSIEDDIAEEVFCAVVPGSESFTLANGIATSNCVYCPKLRDKSCPIAAYNDQMQLTPEEWLKWDLWNSAFSSMNRKRMKARVQATGRPVTIKDYNGKAYTYGPVETKSFVFPLFYKTEKSVATKCQTCGAKFEFVPEEGLCPKCKKGIVRLLMPIVDHIESYLFATPGDTEFAGKLTLSSTTINKYLSTKGRAVLDQAVSDSADEITNAPYKQSKPLESLPDDFDEDEWGESGGF